LQSQSTEILGENIMKCNIKIAPVPALCAVLLCAAGLSTATAWAAQDQTLIQQTRKNQAAHAADESAGASSAKPAATAKPALDHGPRAQVTPWVNRQRQAKQQDAKAAPDAATNTK
jgi:hypothetical protein